MTNEVQLLRLNILALRPTHARHPR